MRIEREKKTVAKMLDIYCRLNHKKNKSGKPGFSWFANANKTLCAECSALKEYAMKRLTFCPYENEKPTCIDCKIHCYRKKEKMLMKEVMRFSGPRMLFRHPYLAVMHLLDDRKRFDEKRFEGIKVQK